MTDLSKNDLSHAIKELNNCLNYQLARELKPKRKKLPVRLIKSRISIKFAKYLSKKYELSKLYKPNILLENALDLVVSNYLSKTNLIRVQNNSIKFLLNKQKNISILDDNFQNKNIEGPIYLKVKFNIEEIILE